MNRGQDLVDRGIAQAVHCSAEGGRRDFFEATTRGVAMRGIRSRNFMAFVMTIMLLGGATRVARSDAPLDAQRVAVGLDFPLFATAPEGDGRLFIVERSGRVVILLGGTILSEPFLDIRQLVSTQSEFGLLSLAFSPEYPGDGLFYVYYINLNGVSVVARFQVSGDPNRADPGSREVLLRIPQPFGDHNGGTIAFGADGHLYFGLGDGGRSNDPNERAQDLNSVFGKMLRFDTSGGPGLPLAIPSDNPFREDPNANDAIWSLGWRNPFRWSFDRLTGDMWVGDVGQSRREEVDFEPAGVGGRNYGWDVMEGLLCNPVDPAPAPACNDPSLVLPIIAYPNAFGACSVTGGYVYRGRHPGLQGLYFYGDWCAGLIWSFDRALGLNRLRRSELTPAAGQPQQLVAFGQDGAGEIYTVLSKGVVHRIRSPFPACNDGFDNDGDGLSDRNDPACLLASQDGELPRNDLVIDIERESINPQSTGVVDVAIFASSRYDLRRGDPDTLTFGPAATPHLHDHAPPIEHVDGDGREDWAAQFRTNASGLTNGDTFACIRVEIASVPFEGCDDVALPPIEGPGGATSGDADAGGSGGTGPAWDASASAGASAAPDILRYIEPGEDCRLWVDCGWVWGPALEVPNATGFDAELPAGGGASLIGLMILIVATGRARLRRT
jgi:glucose/arabinose dehydrogenase